MVNWKMKEKSFQQMTLEQLDIHIREKKNNLDPLYLMSYTKTQMHQIHKHINIKPKIKAIRRKQTLEANNLYTG